MIKLAAYNTKRAQDVAAGVEGLSGRQPRLPGPDTKAGVICDECDTEMEYRYPRGVILENREEVFCPSCGAEGRKAS